MSDYKKEQIHNQDEALASYFDDLLMVPDLGSKREKQEINLKLVHTKAHEESIAKLSNEALPEEKQIEAEPLAVEETIIADTAVETGGELTANTAEQKIVSGDEIADVEVAAEVETVVADVEYTDGRPEWAMNSFKAVVFVINNMKFAIPKFAMNGAQAFTKDLKKMASQPDWVMGLKIEEEGFVAAVDTGHLLLNMPIKNAESAAYTELLLLANSRWGLAVDKVMDEVVIQSKTVNWRKDITTRAWLCGTEASQQLAIVEPANLFKDSE